MSHSVWMSHCIGTGQEPAKTVSKKDELLKTNSFTPFLDVVYKFLLALFSIWSELYSSASSKSRQVNSVDFPVGVKIVKVLVELWNATAKAVDHDKGNTSLFVICRRGLSCFNNNRVDVRIWSNWYKRFLIT